MAIFSCQEKSPSDTPLSHKNFLVFAQVFLAETDYDFQMQILRQVLNLPFSHKSEVSEMTLKALRSLSLALTQSPALETLVKTALIEAGQIPTDSLIEKLKGFWRTLMPKLNGMAYARYDFYQYAQQRFETNSDSVSDTFKPRFG